MMPVNEMNPYFIGNETYKPINPILSKLGDFPLIYILITICSLIFGVLLILNFFCYCSKYCDYWLDRDIGKRSLVPLWSATRRKQPISDFTDLKIHNVKVQILPPINNLHKSHVLTPIHCQPLHLENI